MTLPRHSEELTTILSWNDVLSGAPSILGFAALASRAIALNTESNGELELEAQAILYAARERGSIEIKATKNAYDSSQRLLAVHVELAPERVLAFRSRTNPQFTMAMLDGFRQLCGAGLVMHHMGHDFSLTHRGFRRAAEISADAVDHLLKQAAELDFEA
jgi:hypothetical protein